MEEKQPDQPDPQPLDYAPPTQHVRFAMYWGGWIMLAIVAIIALVWRFHHS